MSNVTISRASFSPLSDPGTSYRTRDEVSEVRAARDPIEKVKRYLLEHELAKEEELKAVDKDIRAEMNEAVKQAKASPEPPMEDQFAHIYTDLVPVRGVELDNSYVPKSS